MLYMESIEIEVISNETIKPSAPTPESLCMYPLSFLDQLSPSTFMPLVYFYAKDGKISNAERSKALKSSLSQVLTTFYPMSGRVKDDELHVFCNDQGVPFIEAIANCKLSEVIKSPVPRELNKFHAYQLWDAREYHIVMAVQVTFFRCHGMAVGLLINHRIADALSFFMFANAWAAAARNEYDDMPRPIFESAAVIFPARQDVAMYRRGMMLQEELVCKIFTFPASKISILRDRYADTTDNVFTKPRRPTRVEALSAFIWSRFIVAKELKLPDPNKMFTVLHAVNLRTRMDPPLSEYYFGNICCFTIATPNMEGSDSDQAAGRQLVQQIRESIRGVNGEYIEKLREGEQYLNFLKKRATQCYKNELVTLNFTSLCRFPLYEADFGWGKPVLVGSASLTYKNIVTFLDTPSGEGIEAWICMTKQDMEKFEEDFELKDFLSVKTAGG